MEQPLSDDTDILEKSLASEYQEIQAWFRSSLIQIGALFAEQASDIEEKVAWDVILIEERLSIRALNRILGNSADNVLRGKHILTYDTYTEQTRSSKSQLYALENGEIASIRERYVTAGPNQGLKTIKFFKGHCIPVPISYKEAEQCLNQIICNMNMHLKKPLRYIGLNDYCDI
jgi:hypothetical protein